MNLSWGEPLWLLGLPLLALFAWLLLSRAGAAVPLPGVAAIGAVPRRTRIVARLPLALRILALALIVVALARPRTPGAVVVDPRAGIPVVVALDVSSSMLAEDFRPRDRLQVAKETVAEFIAGRSEDPVGLVAFAAEAITVSPVTTYRPVLLNALSGLQVGLLPDGTAIGDGLAVAVSRLRPLPGRERVIVLMSDGESNRGAVDPLDAAAAAREFGIRVFAIGVGSAAGARVPVDAGPGEVIYGELRAGLDEALLREIAEVTAGRYYRATDPAALRAIYAEIDRMVATPLEQRRRVRYDEWYLAFLLAAGLVLAGEWLMRGSRWGVIPG